MAKKRLKEIIAEYDITESYALDIVRNVLDEEMVTGRGKNLWINEFGQAMFEDHISVPIIRRGKCVRLPENELYIYVKCQEFVGIVPARIKKGNQKQYLGKVVYIEEDNNFTPPKYTVIKTPAR